MPSNRRDLQLLERDKRGGLNSLFYFGKFILGYNLQSQPHEEMCDFVQDESSRFKILVVPRNSYKTTVGSQMYPMWLLEKNSNHKILLDSEILINSERNLSVIKKSYEGNDRFRAVFGDRVDKSQWNQNAITISSRTNQLLKEPSINTAGIESTQVGPHYTHIIFDDPHSEKNSKTKEQIASVYEHFRLLFSLMDPADPHMMVIATRWADADLCGQIMEKHTDFKILVRAAKDEKGKLYFPAVLTQEILDQLKANQGLDIYNAQYMNDPIPAGDSATFKKESFRYAKEYPKDMRLTLFVDPAVGSTSDGDYFALVVAGLDANNNLWVVDYLYGIFKPYEGIAKAFSLIMKHSGIKTIALETIAFQKVLKFHIETEMKRLNKFISIIEIKHHSQSKVDRIMGLQPRYEQGAITHMEWMRGGELEEELLKFPRGRRRDLADALSFSLSVLKPRANPALRRPQIDPMAAGSVEELVKKHLQEKWKRRNITPAHPGMGTMF